MPSLFDSIAKEMSQFFYVYQLVCYETYFYWDYWYPLVHNFF